MQEDVNIKDLLIKLSHALESSTQLQPLPVEDSQPHDPDRQHLVVKNPWTGESYSWGEEISTEGFRIPYSCISTEYQRLSHAGRSLRLITLFLAYGVEGQHGVIELKKSQIRAQYNFDSRTLERAIYELREAGLLVEIGREHHQKNKPMRYFVMVPINCFGRKSAGYKDIPPQEPNLTLSSPALEPKSDPTASSLHHAGKFPTPVEYKEAKELVQKFYDVNQQPADDKTDPGRLLSDTLLACEMIRFYSKERISKAIAFLSHYAPTPSLSPKKPITFRWFSSQIHTLLETLEQRVAIPASLPDLSKAQSEDQQKKKLAWARLSKIEQGAIKKKVLELYPFIKNEAVLETIAQEMAYQQKQ